MDERIYQGKDEFWYYRSRGTQDAGPFNSRLHAEQALARQIAHWDRKQPFALIPRHWHPMKYFRRSATRQG